MLSFGLAVVVLLATMVRIAGHLGGLMIGQRTERARHVALAGLLDAMSPQSVVLQQHPDGTTCVLVRGALARPCLSEIDVQP